MTGEGDTTGDTDPATIALERRFRRLLRVYPRYYYRHRGPELLATLLDGSAPDQTRPSRAQRRDILRSGLACRLRVRGGPGNVLLAVGLAVTAAVIGSWAGAWLGWLGQPDPPGPRETAAVASTGLPGEEVDEVHGDDGRFERAYEEATGDAENPLWVVFLGSDNYRRAQQVAVVETSVTETDWALKIPRVAGRLEAAGWEVTKSESTTYDNGVEDFEVTAVRDGTVVMFTGDNWEPWIEVELVRTVPASQSAGLAIGAGLGLLAGWLLAVRIAWRLTVVHPGRRTAVLSLFLLPLPLALGVYATAVVASVNSFTADPAADGRPPWFPIMDFPLRPLCLITAVAMAAALAVAFAPGRRSGPRPQPARDRQTA